MRLSRKGASQRGLGRLTTIAAAGERALGAHAGRRCRHRPRRLGWCHQRARRRRVRGHRANGPRQRRRAGPHRRRRRPPGGMGRRAGRCPLPAPAAGGRSGLRVHHTGHVVETLPPSLPRGSLPRPTRWWRLRGRRHPRAGTSVCVPRRALLRPRRYRCPGPCAALGERPRSGVRGEAGRRVHRRRPVWRSGRYLLLRLHGDRTDGGGGVRPGHHRVGRQWRPPFRRSDRQRAGRRRLGSRSPSTRRRDRSGSDAARVGARRA